MSLLEAAENGNIEMVRQLLDDGVDVNIQNRNGDTALIKSSLKGHTDIIKLLLNHGADPNIKTAYGCNALIWASEKGHTDIVDLLLNHGTDANIQNINGETALIWASWMGHTDVVELLTNHMNSIKIQSRIRGNMTRNIARTQKSYQQISTALLPIDFDVANMIGDYLSKIPYNPGVSRKMEEERRKNNI